MTTVLPKAIVVKDRHDDGRAREYEIRFIDLDATVNMYDEPLHVVHGRDYYGRSRMWFETTDSLKALLDDAVGNVCPFANLAGQAYMQRESDRALARLKVALGNYIPQEDTEANVNVALGNS